jgi:hypothetical protein
MPDPSAHDWRVPDIFGKCPQGFASFAALTKPNEAFFLIPA